VTDEMQDDYDVVVVGGGAAGLSGALTLGRSRRSVLVVDAGEPRNAPADGVHNFLTRDGTPPAELAALGRAEVRRYGGHVVEGRVTAAERDGDRFAVGLDDGRTVGARRLLVTTGLVDELPEVDGLRARWGRDVLHCPYCHGWEVRDQTLGVLASGPRAVHQALLFSQWSPDVTLLLNGQPAPDGTEAEDLAARAIRVVEGAVAAVEIADDRLTGARLADGRVVPLQALVVMPRFVARSAVLASLGLEPVPHPMGVGEMIPAEPTGMTAVPGVWVAGNVTDLMAQVMGSAAAGVMAAAHLNADLISEDTARAVAARRAA